MEVLIKLCAAFGLSSSAGLNAYIPLLTVAIMANRKAIVLADGYSVLGSPWCIALLTVLLFVEIVVDKIPGVDHINDIIHSAIRPAAGAVLFASQAGIVHHVHPGVWIVAGLVCGGSVHTVKALARPVVNVLSVGTGAPVVSVVEDLMSVVIAIVAVLVPVLAAILVIIFGYLAMRLLRRFFGKGRAIRVRAEAVEQRPSLEPVESWGGGV